MKGSKSKQRYIIGFFIWLFKVQLFLEIFVTFKFVLRILDLGWFFLSCCIIFFFIFPIIFEVILRLRVNIRSTYSDTSSKYFYSICSIIIILLISTLLLASKRIFFLIISPIAASLSQANIFEVILYSSYFDISWTLFKRIRHYVIKFTINFKWKS